MPLAGSMPARPPPESEPGAPATGFRVGWLLLAFAGALLAAGCESPAELQMRKEIGDLRQTVKDRDNQLAAQKAALEEANRQLAVARSISEDDLKKLFYPERLEIDKLTGGYDSDGKPGDDGVVVYLKPVDKDGDVLKIPGDITIQLYDLAAPPAQNFIGEYKVPVDQVGKLWHGKLWTNHYAIKCPWPHGPPKHPEVTVRVLFVDYLTKRVVSAQATCTVKLPPD